MSFTINLQHRAFESLHLPLKNLIVNLTLPRFLSSSSIRSSADAESFYTSLLDKSTHKTHLFQIQDQLHIHGLQNNGFIITKFINRSFELKQTHHARQVFDEFPERYVFLWNAILRGYSMHEMFGKVVEMYSRMHLELVNPDAYTFPYILKACGALTEIGYGRAVHAQIFRHGFEEDEFLRNGLLSFYVKCEEYASARVIFDRLRFKDVVSWTLFVSGYVQNEQPLEALEVFREMRRSGVKPDWISLVSVVKGYSDIDDLEQGKCVHSLLIKTGYEFEPDLCIALASLYAKCGDVLSAKSFFNQVETKNVMLWNSMISGFAKSGRAVEALEVFNEMISNNIRPDSVTLQSSVLACAQLGSLEQAMWMDNYVNDSVFRDDVIVRTALIDMYSKCGSVELARLVFDETAEKDVVLWSAMIMGYGLHGHGRAAIDLFNRMTKTGVNPNEVTFLGLITGCSRSGLIEEGFELFDAMESYGIEPHQKHYASIVDLLGRAGHLAKAFKFIMSIPTEPSISVWGALLTACEIHGHVKLAEYASRKLFALDGSHAGHYVQLSNLYASARLWDHAARVRGLMKAKGLKKDWGFSEVEVYG